MSKYSDYEDVLLLPQIKSRKAPRKGDVFTLKLSVGGFLIGRVIRTDAKMKFDELDYILLYLYRKIISEPNSKEIEDFAFADKNLAVPPFFGRKQFWTMGYAETVENRPLGGSDSYPTHYFFDHWHKAHFDDDGKEVTEANIEDSIPVGICGLGNLATLDLDLRKSLGLVIPEWGKGYFENNSETRR